MVFKCPTLSLDLCVKYPPKEQSSSAPVVFNKACVYSLCAETLIQDRKLSVDAGYAVHGTRKDINSRWEAVYAVRFKN